MGDHRGRSRRNYYDDDDYYEYERRPRHRSLGRQALDKLESAMGNLGLDSHSGAVTPYHQDRHHNHPHHHSHNHHNHHDYHDHHSHHRRVSSPHGHHHRDHYYHEDSGRHHRAYHSASPPRRTRSVHRHKGSSSRSRSRWDRGIQAAVDAAAIEAFRLRKEPGPWKGPKGSRIATAAISAGVIGAATEHGKEHDGHKQKGALGSALGGLVVNRLVNGPRREVR